jgi:glucose-6-phosphate-specific signal transduction histidine kinase
VLNAKGEKLRPKQLDQLPLVNFLKVVANQVAFSVRILYCKNCSLMGEKFDYGKKGEFFVFH